MARRRPSHDRLPGRRGARCPRSLCWQPSRPRDYEWLGRDRPRLALNGRGGRTMTEDEKKKITSLPPPPTDDIDSDWSRPSGAPPEAKPAKETQAKASSEKPGSQDLTP